MGGWAKALKNYVRVNVDPSFDVGLLRGITGAVIRDNNGGFLAAAANAKLEHVQDAMSAESHAIKQGLILAQPMGCNRIILSPGCLKVVNILKVGGNSAAIAAMAIDDCYYLATEFSKVISEHCYVRQIV
jgi:hypothetical protein